MSSLNVINAVNARLAANWSHTPIVYPNTVGFVPTSGDPYLEVLYPVTTESQLTFGSPGANFHEELGGFRVCLYIPVGVGINPTATPWMTRIETLMGVFRSVQFDGIECNGFAGPTIRDDSDDGAYFEISFAVSYRYFITA